MRLLLYNIRYATGAHPKQPLDGYLKRTQENLQAITAYIKSVEPDIIGMLEVDGGTYRSRGINQAHYIAEKLGHYHSYRGKYGQASLTSMLPMFKNQGNAFIVKNRIQNEKFHFFRKGVKRLVIELELEPFDIYLVHLALGFRARRSQLKDLATLINQNKRPKILAGDFNPFRGEKELTWFLEETGLKKSRKHPLPTYPSWKPIKELDFILSSEEIKVSGVTVPRVDYSDHLPLIYDFSL